ncbi:hypothetical protein FQN57_004955 [Myotisia sp. PD_48]|nr:hypothetical protein FQN57_004955 [Myotisia sp. PD_48]
MATTMSEEDLAWFKSTFRPIPKPQLPDDCVEYSLYWISPSDEKCVEDQSDLIRTSLGKVQKSASELVKKYLKDYIWQRDGFKLELTKEDGFHILRGRTQFGDSIEDEWVVVYLLRQLTRNYEHLWVKLTDSDGEFLLVEAAGVLPAWLDPDIADNRVWINRGELVIVKPELQSTLTKNKVTEKLTFRDAYRVILTQPKRLMRSPTIAEEAFYRLRNYPKQIENNLHSTLITLPRKVAYLLHTKPAYVSPAVEAFYLRDPISLRPLRMEDSKPLIFVPEDFVTVSVKFTKVGFAQVKSQDFPIPSKWEGCLPTSTDSKESERAITGMKLTCGFEMLLSDPQNCDKPSVREIKLVLDDIETGEEVLPTDEEIQNSWEMLDNDESWLDISFDDLETELKGRQTGESSTKNAAFGDKAAQENLQRIVSRFEEFLNDDAAGFDGAELINEFGSDDSEEDGDDDEDELSSDGEDKEASFNEAEFSRMMEEMMGLPPGSNIGAASSRTKLLNKIEEVPSDDEVDSDQIKGISNQMEAELIEAGFFGQERGPEQSKNKGKTPIRGDNSDTVGDSSVQNDDITLARNLLASLESQAGAAGPASNILGMMGMKPPRDDRK